MFNVSCIQLTSDNNVFSNLEKTTDLIIGSIKKKADFIITPENTSLFTLDHRELLEKAEEMNNNFFLESISRISKSYKKWILIGSLPIKLSKKLLANRSVLFNPNGKIANYYDKIHMFDCVMPTRNARNGMLFTSNGIINIQNEKWKNDFSPLEVDSELFADTQYTKAYLRHLMQSKEILAAQIASLHNLHFYLWLMKEARSQIIAGTFYDWKNKMVKQLAQRL